MSISSVLIELRNEKGLSQKQVANATGISQSTIAKIEINRNEATASTIRKLADFFQVSSDYLLELEDDFGIKQTDNANSLPAYSKEEEQLIKDYRALNYAGKKLVKQTVETLRATSAQSEQKKNKIS